LKRILAERELLDLPKRATRSEIEGNLADITKSNRWLGGTAVVLRHLSHLIGVSPARQPIRILDLGAGAADIPVAIMHWARDHGIAVQIAAVDANPGVLEYARRITRGFPEICLAKQNILDLRYGDRCFDFVVCSQILHHLENDEALSVLRSANRLSTQGIVVSDLRRRTICTYGSGIGSRFLRNRLSRHDARLSFRNAFTADEMRELAERAELPCFTIRFHGPCRFALIVDKRATICQPETNHSPARHARVMA
jgi:ubiquinone/menaquinone biosynthesis C-methylase UbiE